MEVDGTEVKQRIALVTGSSSGIGRAVAERLLGDGWLVVGLARQHDKFRPESQAYQPVTVDFADSAALSDTMKTLSRERPFDAVISNAGRGLFGGLETFSLDQIRDYLNVNLYSHLLVARSTLPGMKSRGRGHLIFMGSESALRGARRGSLYCTAKFGLRGLAQSLRDESSNRGVKVTIINPGMVRTPFFDALGFGPGEEVANAIEPSEVANAVSLVVNSGPGVVYDEINLSPLKKVGRFD